MKERPQCSTCDQPAVWEITRRLQKSGEIVEVFYECSACFHRRCYEMRAEFLRCFPDTDAPSSIITLVPAVHPSF
jgi:hypothetical protein